MDLKARRLLDAVHREQAVAARTADVLVGVLGELGVDVVFGLPGGAISPIYDALLDRPEIRVITTRHESGAMFAAAGYARATGKIGVVLTTSGPGVINTLTGLANAQAEGLPLLLLAGEVSRRLFGQGALQDGSAQGMNIIEMVRHVSKLAVQVANPTSVEAALRRAVAVATSGRRGPVAMTLPIDVTTAPAQPGAVSVDMSVTYQVPTWALEQAVRAFSESKRTVIFAGAGMRSTAGARRLKEFAEWLQAPVMTTPKGKGVFPEDHPLSLGVYGLGGHPSATAHLDAGIDVLLALGTSLGEISTNGWSKQLVPRKTFIHVDLEPANIGRAYSTTLGVTAPAEMFLEKVMERMPRARRLAPAYGLSYHSNPSQMTVGPEGKLAPQRALWEMQQVLPRDTLYTVDSGEHYLYAVHYLRVREPDGFIAMSGLGSMGSGICAAIGAKLAQPSRPVVAICGDGGFTMVAGELATAVAEKIPVLFLVMNDERLGMVERGHSTIYGRSPSFATGPLRIPLLAAGLGAECMVVERPGQILEMELALRRQTGPLVIEVRIDPSMRMPKNARVDSVFSQGTNKPTS